MAGTAQQEIKLFYCYAREDKPLRDKLEKHLALNARNDLKRYQEALAAYEQAIHLDPDYAFAYYDKGLALEALGKIQQAQQAYERARQLGYSG